jgi:hypothetical protein
MAAVRAARRNVGRVPKNLGATKSKKSEPTAASCNDSCDRRLTRTAGRTACTLAARTEPKQETDMLGGIMGMMGGPMGSIDPKGLNDALTQRTSSGWGEWEATSTVVLNADADCGRDGSIASDALATGDYYLI